MFNVFYFIFIKAEPNESNPVPTELSGIHGHQLVQDPPGTSESNFIPSSCLSIDILRTKYSAARFCKYLFRMKTFLYVKQTMISQRILPLPESVGVELKET